MDFGSTYTKVTAVDLEREELIGWSQARTTIDTDITAGLNPALSKLAETCEIAKGKIKGNYACSSAAGDAKALWPSGAD